MDNKHNFVEECLKEGLTFKSAQKVWNSISELRKHVEKNWDRCKNLIEKPDSYKLYLRRMAAEQGIEWTPSEIDEMFKILSMVQNKMEEEKNWEPDL